MRWTSALRESSYIDKRTGVTNQTDTPQYVFNLGSPHPGGRPLITSLL
jgi:hypothetical protein